MNETSTFKHWRVVPLRGEKRSIHGQLVVAPAIGEVIVTVLLFQGGQDGLADRCPFLQYLLFGSGGIEIKIHRQPARTGQVELVQRRAPLRYRRSRRNGSV
jgi:hypothetical protein